MRRSLLVLLLVASAAPAGVYSPDDPCPFNVKPDGPAEPLPHRLFVAMLVDRMAPRVPNLPAAPGIPDWAFTDDGTVAQATYAARLSQLLAARWPKADQLRGDDLLAHTAALLRFNATQPAVNLLDRGRVGRSYTLKANRAHTFATSREWADALTNLPDEPDSPPPPPAGTSAEQFRWQRAVDQSAYRRWLDLRNAEAGRWKAAADRHPEGTPFALFVTADGVPIRFWESADEAKKLPAEATAVVQQMLLWAPWDDRLLWTLAEVYVATGKMREAFSAYEMLASNEGRQFQGPRLLSQLLSRVPKPPDDEGETILPSDPPAPKPDRSGLVFGLVDPIAFYVSLGVFAVVAAVLLGLQLRALLRWLGRFR